jgi:hypothetical protein
VKVTKYLPGGGYCLADTRYMTKREALKAIEAELTEALDIAQRDDKASRRVGRTAVELLGWELFALTRSTKEMQRIGERAAGDSQERLGIIDHRWDGIGGWAA